MIEKESYKLSIQGLSPLYIGSGDTYSQLDYISTEGKIHILDFNKILSSIPEEVIDDLTNDITENFHNNRWQGNVEEFLNKYNINWRDFIEKSYTLIGEIKKNEINQFIKTGDFIYIPGSSIKGAIRTSILYYILENHPREKAKISQEILSYFNHREINKLIQSDGKTDLMRALVVSDQKLQSDKANIKIGETAVYHLKDKTSTIPIFNEILDKGFQSEGTIKINQKLIDFGNLIVGNFDLSWQNLIEAINSFSEKIINYELEVFTKQDDSNLEGIITYYKELQNQLNSLNENECILRLGQGSSALGITLFLSFADNNQVVRKYKKLEIIRFDQPDNRNPGFAIARQGRTNVFIDRKSEMRPRMNETWLCSIVSDRRNTKYVSLIEKITLNFEIKGKGGLLYPLTRKFAVSSTKSLLFPFGWVKVKLE